MGGERRYRVGRVRRVCDDHRPRRVPVLFTEVWPDGSAEPWYALTARTFTGAVAFVGLAAVPGLVVTAASPSRLAILALVTAPMATAAHHYMTRV